MKSSQSNKKRNHVISLSNVIYGYNFCLYLFKRRFQQKNYLSYIGDGKFPSIERKSPWLPTDKTSLWMIISLLLIFFLFNDVGLNQFIWNSWKINIAGVGNLGNLGAAGWGVLATIISVRLIEF
jgi:hypothetical protein